MKKARPELSFTDNINENDSLYRYISLAQFLSLVENEELLLKKSLYGKIHGKGWISKYHEGRMTEA